MGALLNKRTPSLYSDKISPQCPEVTFCILNDPEELEKSYVT